MPARGAGGRFVKGGGLGEATGTIRLDYDGSGATRAIKDLDGIGNSATKAGRTTQNAGRLMAGAGAIIAGGFLLAIRNATSFEKQMSSIQAVSGATAAQMELLRAKALQLGKDTKFSAGEAASAIEEVVKAGVSVPDALNGAADAAVALAAAGEIDLPQAATIASNAMNQFQLAAKDLPHVADEIAGAANASAISVTDMGDSLSYVGPVAKAVGVSITDTATAIAILGNNGIRGSSAGTALRSVLTNLIPTTRIAKKEFAALGLTTKDGGNLFIDAEGKLKPLDQVVQILNDHTKNLSATARNTFAKRAFGLETLSTVSILANQTADSFDTMTDSINKVSAADVAKTRMDNFSGSLEQLKGTVETVTIVMGTPFLKVLRTLADAINKVLAVVLQMPGPIRDLLGILTGASGVLLTFGGAFLLLAPRIRAARVELALLAEGAMWQRIAAGIAAVTRVVNPWILAFTAAAAVVGALLFMNKKSRPPIDDLTQAFVANTDALSAENRALEANRLAADGTLQKAKDLGFNLQDMTEAALGNADAQKRLADAFDAARGPFQTRLDQVDALIGQSPDYTGALVAEHDKITDQLGALDDLASRYHAQAGDVTQATKNAHLISEAQSNVTATTADQTKGQDLLNEALGRNRAAAANAAGGNKPLKTALDGVGTAAKGTATDIKTLDDNLKKLFDSVFGAPRALDAFQRQLNLIKQNAKDNGTALHGTTNEVLDNKEAFRVAATEIGDVASTMAQAGEPTDRITAKIGQMKDNLYRLAGQAGYSKSQVRDLIDNALNQIPQNIDPTIAVHILNEAKAKAFMAQFHDITIDVAVNAHTSNLRQLEQQAANAATPHLAGGGLVTRATYALIGEGGSPEIVQPVPDYAKQLVRVFQAGQTSLVGSGATYGGGGGSRVGAPAPSGHRIVQGTLMIHPSGRAFIKGLAEDVYDGSDQFTRAYARMGG